MAKGNGFAGGIFLQSDSLQYYFKSLNNSMAVVHISSGRIFESAFSLTETYPATVIAAL
jgi:hypothetical protein